MTTPTDLAVEYVAADTLLTHPDNPRRGNVDTIGESLAENGQYKPLVVQRGSNHVLAGNHTLLALRAQGVDRVAVVYLDVDDTRARKILLADNRTSDRSRYDDQALLDALAALEGDLLGTGYTVDDQDDLTYLLQGVAEVALPGTDAHFNETDDELAARADQYANRTTLAARGVAEVVLIVQAEQKEELYAWLQELRERWGAELSNGEVVMEAVRRAVTA